MKMAKDKKKKAIDAEINRALLDDFDKFNVLIHRRWKDMIYYSIAIVVIVAVIAFVISFRNKKLAKAENVLRPSLAKTSSSITANICVCSARSARFPASKKYSFAPAFALTI